MAIERKVRAFNPWPIAFSQLNAARIRIWKALPLELEATAASGIIIKADQAGIDVATGDKVLRILELQLPGRKILTAAQVLNSQHQLFAVGAKFDG